MQLAEFGATSAGGVNRQALSQEEIAARKALVSWAREAGLMAFNDPVGNLFFRLEGLDADAAPGPVGIPTSTLNPRAASSTAPSAFSLPWKRPALLQLQP